MPLILETKGVALLFHPNEEGCELCKQGSNIGGLVF